MIEEIFQDKDHYIRMANEANQVSLGFKESVMIEKILTILNR